MKSTFIIVIIFSVNIITFAQSKIDNCKHTQVRLIQSKPSVYLSFEKNIKTKPLFQGENEDRVLLKFNNNTIWTIYVGTFSVEKEYGDFGLPYEVNAFPPKRGSDFSNSTIPSGYKIISSVKAINSGNYFLFSIPKEHLIANLYISISFNYEWEEGWFAGGSGVETIHKTSFLASQLQQIKK